MPVCEEWQALAREFYTDSHKYWPKREDDAAKCALRRTIRKSGIRSPGRPAWSRSGGREARDGEDLLAAQFGGGKNADEAYRDFLQKFAVLHEELHADPEEFDLGYYTYGLSVYGNLPLIEPLESREVKKIHEFVIVIDTSYSTSGELVEQFLRETANILHQSDSFFARSVIRVLQCDNVVRSDAKDHG